MPYNYYTNQYMPAGYNPYLMNQVQRVSDPYQTNQINQMQRQVLQGKVVDSVEVVKRNRYSTRWKHKLFPTSR